MFKDPILPARFGILRPLLLKLQNRFRIGLVPGFGRMFGCHGHDLTQDTPR